MVVYVSLLIANGLNCTKKDIVDEKLPEICKRKVMKWEL